MRRDDIAEIKAALLARLPSLVGDLAPRARRHGAYWSAPNPTRVEKSDSSFRIWSNGAWCEYDSGEKGDVIDLVAYAKGQGRDRAFALRWARDWLGLEQMDPAERQGIARAALAAADRRAKADAAAKAKKRASAVRIGLAAGPIRAGDPVDLYLRGRGVDLAAIPHRNALDGRTAPRLRNWRADRDGPAMVWRVREAGGDVSAVHLTFLEADGDGFRKLACDAPKLMLGDVLGAVVWISHGPSGLDPLAAAAAGRRDPLIVGEGIETCLSLALACPEARVWAALSLGNIAHAPLDSGCAGDVFVALENDVKRPALEMRARVLERVTQRIGRPPGELVPPTGADFNDVLMER